LSLSRTSITKWRLYDPVFQAGLNRRRWEVWGSGIDRLLSLIPKALDALAEELENKGGRNRVKAALELLRMIGLPSGVAQAGSTDPEAIVRGIVKGRREAAPGGLDDLFEDGKNLPPFDKHLAEVWAELEARANEPDEAAAEADAGSRS
jgi:hypothetical protein